MPTLRLPPQVALITGASSGLGAELARQLARDGMAVGLVARREEALLRLASEIEQAGGQVAAAPADVTDRPGLRRAIESIGNRLGPISLLVANAGVGLATPAIGFSARDLTVLLEVNVLGAANAIELVLPGMLERRAGHLVGVSSLAAYRGFPGSSGYCASKAALSILLEGLRVDLRGTGIDVTTIHPGFVRTPMTEGQDRSQPFLMEPEAAAQIMARGIRRRKRCVNFPWQANLAMTVASGLPGVLFDRLADRANVRAASDRPNAASGS